VGSVGDAYDNALAESFVDSFKTELIADRVWRSRPQLELAVVEYIGWFNHARLHEALGDIPPAEMEALYAPQTETNLSLETKRGSQLTRSPWKPVRLRRPHTAAGSRPSASKPSGRTSCSSTCPSTASSLNQIEIVFSVIQRKVLTPNDFASLQAVVDRLDAFERHYNQIAEPFEWNFTRRDLAALISRVADHEPRLKLAAWWRRHLRPRPLSSKVPPHRSPVRSAPYRPVSSPTVRRLTAASERYSPSPSVMPNSSSTAVRASGR
jgi:hypothetical protein